ncbi:MAG: TIGR03621 family F420-dependent LLM class oxidoreductase [Acidimicrobiales bacterium]
MTARPFRFAVQSGGTDTPDAWRDLARRAEQLGYSTLAVADHYIGPGPALEAANHPVQQLAAIPAMTVAAEATTDLSVACRVLSTGYHNAVVAAKELASIDWFSGGRVEVGLGAGWVSSEYEAMGVPFERAGRRVDRLIEFTSVLRACFAGGPVDENGEIVSASGFTAVPEPPHGRPPLMIGGGSPRVLRFAGGVADTVSVNFDNSSGRIGAEGMASGAAEATAAKIAWVRDGAGDRFADIELEVGAYFTAVTGDPQRALDRIATTVGVAPELLDGNPHVLVGSAEEIVDTLLARREQHGFSYVTVDDRVMEAFAPVVAALAGR